MSAPDPAKLSLNTATIREKWGLAQAIEGCARHGIRGMVERAGYAGFHEVEIFSTLDWWQRDPDEVLAICKDPYVKAT